jgi:hypothetical protein
MVSSLIGAGDISVGVELGATFRFHASYDGPAPTSNFSFQHVFVLRPYSYGGSAAGQLYDYAPDSWVAIDTHGFLKGFYSYADSWDSSTNQTPYITEDDILTSAPSPISVTMTLYHTGSSHWEGYFDAEFLGEMLTTIRGEGDYGAGHPGSAPVITRWDESWYLSLN